MTLTHDTITRLGELDRDRDDMIGFISDAKAHAIDLLGAAVADGHAVILVAELEGHVVGWSAVRTHYRPDTGWSPGGRTVDFVVGDNAYLEFFEVAATVRRRGIGSKLLQATERQLLAAGRTRLWLHTGEANIGAQRLYERNGWRHVDTIHPAWKGGEATRIYVRDLP